MANKKDRFTAMIAANTKKKDVAIKVDVGKDKKVMPLTKAMKSTGSIMASIKSKKSTSMKAMKKGC